MEDDPSKGEEHLSLKVKAGAVHAWRAHQRVAETAKLLCIPFFLKTSKDIFFPYRSLAELVFFRRLPSFLLFVTQCIHLHRSINTNGKLARHNIVFHYSHQKIDETRSSTINTGIVWTFKQQGAMHTSRLPRILHLQTIYPQKTFTDYID